ncbi:MAG: restriction endonuclease subunit S [Bacteroidales bacterium]|nr:restriction endonuclease subunit S [Bacteroidales bacterium]MEE1094479.1 restriction endonuclease subunit S [Bacteroidales bacterium]
MKKLSEIFNFWYGVNLELVNCEVCSAGIPFVSRTSNNNGVVARVSMIDGITPNPSHTLSLAGGGSVLSCFYQDEPYYSGRDLFVLSPKEKMSKKEMILYSYIISSNKYRYNYGRQANKSFQDLMLPEIGEIKHLMKDTIDADYSFKEESILPSTLYFDCTQWKWFRYNEIFDIKKGFYNKKPEESGVGTIPFIGATESNNGITSMHTLEEIEAASKTGDNPNQDISEKVFAGNCITVSNDGSIGFAFYQEKEFTCSHSVNPLYLKGYTLNKYIAMFLCTLIELEQYRWAYGRKWRPKRMPSSLIKLPIKADGTPDWEFMENYIKSLPYSANI